MARASRFAPHFPAGVAAAIVAAGLPVASFEEGDGDVDGEVTLTDTLLVQVCDYPQREGGLMYVPVTIDAQGSFTFHPEVRDTRALVEALRALLASPAPEVPPNA